jgi:hypothetical protein
LTDQENAILMAVNIESRVDQGPCRVSQAFLKYMIIEYTLINAAK